MNKSSQIHRTQNAILSLFKSNGRFSLWLIIIFFFINAVVFLNAILHDPRVGYDADGHLGYVSTLAFHNRLPNQEDSCEFFSPPAPYILPAVFLYVISKLNVAAIDNKTLLVIASKLAQLLNLVFSLGLTLYILKFCQLLRSENARFKTVALFFLALLPVYYKSFSFVRGEPILAFLIVVAVYRFAYLYLNEQYSISGFGWLGLILGLAILSRQWAFFLFPAFAIFVFVSGRTRSKKNNVLIIRFDS